MKIQAMALLAGFSAPLIFGGSASGGFLGVECCAKPNPFGLLTVNVYAVFDRPGEDFMFGVAGTPTTQLTIEVMGGGSFYQHPFGDDQAPDGGFLGAMPSLAYDTFVTIGVKCVGDPPCQPEDTLTLSPNFPTGITGSSFAGRFAWAVIPTAPQGDPFNPPFSFPGNGQILIGQFSTADGTAITGTMLLQYVSNGLSGQSIVSFGIPTPGVLPMIGVAGLIGARRRSERSGEQSGVGGQERVEIPGFRPGFEKRACVEPVQRAVAMGLRDLLQ